MLARLIQIRAILAILVALMALRATPAWAQDEKDADIEEEPGAEEEDTGKVDPDQPSVYSGGRYTIDTFPLSELDRTLLLVQGVLEIRADLGIDMSKGSTFDTWALALEGHYGMTETLELQGGLGLAFITPEGVDKAIEAFAAVEGSIMYDLVDWRVGVDLPLSPDFAFDIFAGLPVKIRILKERLAIVALEKILTIHTKSVPKPTASDPGAEGLQKPDLTISLGVLVQVINQLAVIIRGEVTSVGFEGDPVVALSIDGQYTISNRLDVGVSLILQNLTAKEAKTEANPDPKSIPVDNRAVAFFVRFRI